MHNPLSPFLTGRDVCAKAVLLKKCDLHRKIHLLQKAISFETGYEIEETGTDVSFYLKKYELKVPLTQLSAFI